MVRGMAQRRARMMVQEAWVSLLTNRDYTCYFQTIQDLWILDGQMGNFSMGRTGQQRQVSAGDRGRWYFFYFPRRPIAW